MEHCTKKAALFLCYVCYNTVEQTKITTTSKTETIILIRNTQNMNEFLSVFLLAQKFMQITYMGYTDVWQ